MNHAADILIAGAGPVGLALAAALARQGISCAVFEELAELSNEARASTIHPPTLEMFAEWGFVDDVLAQGRVIDRLQFWERGPRALIAEFNYAALAADTPYPFRFQCPQSIVTRCILPHLQRLKHSQVHFGSRVTHVSDCGVHVEAVVATRTGVQTWRGQYLIGADGSRSLVRNSLGLGFSGMTYEDRFLLFATDLDLQKYFPGMGPVAYLFDPEEWVIVMYLPKLARLVFQLKPHEDAAEAQRADNIRARICRFTAPAAEFTVSGAWVYNIHQRVTERFRVGRILLAGDAAHINNPTGGLGMNSGVHDAWFLAHALAAALNGDDGQLDVYAETRHQAAREGIQRMSDKNYNNLTIADEAARAARNRELRAAAADPVKAREFLLRQAMLEDWLTQRPARKA